MVVDEFWPALLYRVASVHCGLQVFKYAQLSYGLEAWTLSLSLQNRDSFFSPTLLYICCSSWGHCPVAWASLGQALAFIQMDSHFTLKNFGMQMSSWLILWLQSASHHQPSFIVLTVDMRFLCCVIFLQKGWCLMVKHLPFGCVCQKMQVCEQIVVSHWL